MGCTEPVTVEGDLSGSDLDKAPAHDHATSEPPSSGSDESVPVVIVEGFLCATSSAVWGGFADEMERGSAAHRSSSHASSKSHSGRSRPPRQVVFAPIGPVSSLHDRACELFYGLRGGRVDYGAKHARGHGHGRYGRRFEKAALPQLFEPRRGKERRRRSAHFIGHSLGGPTIYKLQQLLRQGFFDSALRELDPEFQAGTASDLILSITTISSPLRGTPIVHLLGLEPLPYPVVRRWSTGDWLAKAVHVAAFLDRERLPLPGWVRRRLPDTFADAWHFSPRRRPELGEEHVDEWSWRKAFGIATLYRQFLKSDWAEGVDCGPWDSTIHERMRVEDEEEAWGITGDAAKERTWYCCIAAAMTERASTSDVLEHHTPRSSSWFTDLLAASPLGTSARLLGRFPFVSMTPPPRFLTNDKEHQTEEKKESAELLLADSGYNSPYVLDADGAMTSVASPRRCSLTDSESSLPTTLPSLASLLADSSPPSSSSQSAGKLSSMSTLEAWHANDGIVPLASQLHPRECVEGLCTHHEWHQDSVDDGDEAGQRASAQPALVDRLFGSIVTPWTAWILSAGGDADKTSTPAPHEQSMSASPGCTAAAGPAPNHYHTHLIPNTTHASLAPLWTASRQQVEFWRFVGGWFASVEEAEETWSYK